MAWPRWVPLVPLALGVLLLLVVWMRMKTYNYRLTTQRLLVRRGWLAKHLNELELYRVKDVVVDQGLLQRVLGYGTVTVLSDWSIPPFQLASSVVGLKSSQPKLLAMVRGRHRYANRLGDSSIQVRLTTPGRRTGGFAARR